MWHPLAAQCPGTRFAWPADSAWMNVTAAEMACVVLAAACTCCDQVSTVVQRFKSYRWAQCKVCTGQKATTCVTQVTRLGLNAGPYRCATAGISEACRAVMVYGCSSFARGLLHGKVGYSGEAVQHTTGAA